MSLDSIKQRASQALAKALDEAFDHRAEEIHLEVPPKRELGDLAWPGALPLAKELKALGSTIPIYMLSSVGDQMNMTADYAELGLSGVIQKPIAPETLLTILRMKLK